MKAVVFFVCIFSLLFCGGDHAYAGNDHQTANRYLHRAAKTCLHHRLIKNSSLDEQDQFLIDDEVEDEYTNIIFARKLKPINREYLILPDTFMLSYLRNFYGDQHSTSVSSLSRYITQRVLRI